MLAPACPNLKGHDGSGNGGVEAVGPPGHRDFDEEVALGFVIGGQALLLIADEEKAGFPVARREIAHAGIRLPDNDAVVLNRRNPAVGVERAVLGADVSADLDVTGFKVGDAGRKRDLHNQS